VVFVLLDELLEEKGVEARDARVLAARVEKILRHAGRGRERLAARHLRRLERQVTLERHGGLLPEAALWLLAASHAAIRRPRPRERSDAHDSLDSAGAFVVGRPAGSSKPSRTQGCR